MVKHRVAILATLPLVWGRLFLEKPLKPCLPEMLKLRKWYPNYFLSMKSLETPVAFTILSIAF